MASLERGGDPTEFETYGERDKGNGRERRPYVLEWKDGEVRQQEFGTPGGVDWSDLRSTVRSTLPPAAAAVKQRGAMSNVVEDFPRIRFLMSVLAWLALCYHISLASRGCCAETGLAWAPGANQGFCECTPEGIKCDDDKCCMHGSCMTPVNKVCTTEGIGRITCPDECTVIEASELELPARTPKSCTCCVPKRIELRRRRFTESYDTLYDDAGSQIVWSFVVFCFMWYFSFATDLNWGIPTVVLPICFCCDDELSGDYRMQTFFGCDKHDRGSLRQKLRAGVYSAAWDEQRHSRDRGRVIVGAEAFTALTRRACNEVPTIMMNHVRYCEVPTGARKQHTKIVITHRAQENWSSTIVSDESSAPLFPVRTGDETVRYGRRSRQLHWEPESEPEPEGPVPGDVATQVGAGWEIPYISASGEPRVARSRTGLIELRVTFELCFETAEEESAFKERFVQFQNDNRVGHDQSDDQNNYVSTKFNQERSYVCELEEGATPWYLNMNFFYLSSFLALGWLYQVWYDSLTTPVELHLRKTIRRTTASVPTRPEHPPVSEPEPEPEPWAIEFSLAMARDAAAARLRAREAELAPPQPPRAPSEVRVIIETL